MKQITILLVFKMLDVFVSDTACSEKTKIELDSTDQCSQPTV